MAEKQTNKDRMREIVDSIENGIKELFESDKYRKYLATMSRFHRYSVNNTMLIYMQRPDATHVAGFNKWRDQFGRNVLKGEKGIRIIAPTPYKKKVEEIKTDPETNAPVLDADGKAIIEEKEIRIPMFKVVSVFDVSQTAGKPLPQLAADLSGNVQQYEVFMEALRRASPVPIEIKPVAHDTDGFFSIKAQSITIRAGMSEVQTVCAAVHEIAHAKLHDYEHMTELADDGETILVPGEKSRNTEEVEAESISYAVCQYYGIETGENSFGYIATWSKGKELKELRASLETINKTASELITDIDRHFAEICKERGINREEVSATQTDEALYLVDGSVYLHVQHTDGGWDYSLYDKESKKLLDGGVIDSSAIEDSPVASVAGAVRTEVFAIQGMTPTKVTFADMKTLEDLQEAQITPPLDSEQITGAVVVPTDDTDTMLPELEQATPMPDPTLTVDDMRSYGYLDSDMLPLSKDRAVELLEHDITVYMLYPDNAEEMVFEAEDIIKHDGMFGVTRPDWDAVKGHIPPRDVEQRFLNSPTDAMAIYQLRRDAPVELRFANLGSLAAPPDPANYEAVYTREVYPDDDTGRILENFYYIFNDERPGDFVGHSLSVSDIVALKQDGKVKRDRPIEIEPDWVHLGQNEDGFAINRYFVDHPEMILGRQTSESTQYGKQDFTVVPIEGLALADQLHDAVKNIRGTYQEAELPELGEGEQIDTSIPADPNVKNYSYTVVGGEVYYRENSRMVKPELNATAAERVKGMVALRDCVNELIALQMDEYSAESRIQEAQTELNRLYDAFSAKHGLINDRANRLAFSDDSSYYLLCSLEVLDDDGKLERKADMFHKRTIKQQRSVDSVDTASEALAVCIGEKACVDLDFMASLMGGSEKIPQIVEDLKGVIYKEPNSGPFDLEDGGEHWAKGWQTADEYLSGNVRQKLRTAQRVAARDPFFAGNVDALIAAQPKDLEASEIEVRLGATWLDKKYIEQFMYETFDTPRYLRGQIEISYVPYTAEWQVSRKSMVRYNDVAAFTTYGTDRASAYRLLEDALNLRDIRIYDTIEDADGRERRVLNAKETTLAAQKQQLIRDAFKDWIWKDPDRRETLVRQYNEEMNSTRPREYDGSHIVFSGMNPEITLREHQKNAIAHVLYGGNTLLAHEVGAGKTFEMVASAMESKRLGLCQKSIFVVPNHLTEQWASEFLRLYPSANILVTTKKDFETHNRKKFCARIATGDYDAVIIGHSQFERIPISPERQERLLHQQIEEITDGIQDTKLAGGNSFTIKSLERTKKGLEARLKKLQASDRKDDVIYFEQLGVDRMFVDESDNYKNLFLYTKMRNVAGLSTTDAQKSSDMFSKCRYMDELTGGRGVVFATGTPVSNSMTELYTIQRYLQHDRLQDMGMGHFDCWASRFGETTTALELAPEGYTLVGR